MPLKNEHSMLIHPTGYFCLDSLIRVTSNSFPNICSLDTKSLLTTTPVQPVSLKTLTSFPFTVPATVGNLDLKNSKYPCYLYGDSPYNWVVHFSMMHAMHSLIRSLFSLHFTKVDLMVIFLIIIVPNGNPTGT